MSKPLKEGYLVKAHPKEGLFAVTVWQKRYFILWPTGTMEYYTSYQKLPEEYCSTMDLKETIDILAPVSVGKKHNVIKLTVKKNNKDKDYWLDCDCPTLLNEWVRCMVNVAGLSPEDQDDCFPSSNGIGTTEPYHHQQRRLDKPSDAAKRRLPSLPMVMDMEYEVPSKEGEFYEEISPVHSPIPEEDINKPRRYSRVIGGGSKQNIKGTEVVKNDMLKRSPLPLSDGSSPSPTMNQSPSGTLPTDNISTSSPPPNAPMRGVGTVNHQELQKRLSIRRQELYDAVGNQVNQDSDGEAYEEVQFSAEVTVGDRNTAGVRLRNKQPLSRNKDEVNPKLSNIPVKPAWDSTIIGNITSNSSDCEDVSSKRPAMRVPLRDSVLLEMSGTGSSDFSSPPPIPPRETNTSSSSPPLYIQHGSSSPPPPIPNRVSIGGQRPKIQSYYTTEIKNPPSSSSEPPSIANGYNSESDQSSSGDSVVIRPSNKLMPSSTHGGSSSQPLSLLANVIGPGGKPATSSGKPAPPISTKPVPTVKPATPSVKPAPPSAKPTPLSVKPTPPVVKPKPSTSPPVVRPKPNLKDSKPNPPPAVAKKPQHTKSMGEIKTSSIRDEHLEVNRAPAKLPKPTKISPTLPIKDSTPPAMTPKKKQISAPTVIGSPELPRKGVVNHALPPLPSKHNTAPALPPRNVPQGSAPLINKGLQKSSSKPLPSKPHPLQSSGDSKQALRRPPMPLPKVKSSDL